MFDMCLM